MVLSLRHQLEGEPPKYGAFRSDHIISTVKHFAFNDQESARTSLSARIDPLPARMSDLLAFEIAIERSHPGTVMCASQNEATPIGTASVHLPQERLPER